MPPTAALGFRVKSGWAAAVLVEGPADAPRVLGRTVVQLSDPSLPASRQPYHAATGLAREEGSAELGRLIKGVESYAERSLAGLLDSYTSLDRRLCGAGLVVGSDIDPARIENPHIRAHASEGRLFRVVLEAAMRSHDLPCTNFVERDLLARATGVLGFPAAALKRALTDLGRPLDGHWRRDDKMAALAAWLVVASHPR